LVFTAHRKKHIQIIIFILLRKKKAPSKQPLCISAVIAKNKRSHSVATNVYSTAKQKGSTKTNPEENAEVDIMCKRKKRKKLIFPNSRPKPGMVKETKLSSTAGLLFSAGKGILSGITGKKYYCFYSSNFRQ